MPLQHARIGPSGHFRALYCPASVRESEGLPRQPSIYAAEGTVLHEIAEACLEFGFEPIDFVGLTISADGFSFEITEDLVTCMYDGLDWLREQPGEVFVEKRVSLEPWMPDQFGTCDVGIWQEDTKHVIIYDWKFGMGVPVQPQNNMQGRAYALGFIQTYLIPQGFKPETVSIVIEQPRCPGGGRYYEPWTISYEELLEYGGIMRHIYKRAHDPAAPFGPRGDVCQFCPVKDREPAPGQLSGCRAFDAFNTSLFGPDEFEDLDDLDEIIPPKNLTPQRRALVVKSSGTITKWLAQIHEDSMACAEAGEPDPGLKRVAGRMGKRKWTNEKRAERILKIMLRDDAFTRSLKSPTKAETDLRPRRGKKVDPRGWKLLSKLITQSEGKPVLVDTDNAKPELPALTDMFDDLD